MICKVNVFYKYISVSTLVFLIENECIILIEKLSVRGNPFVLSIDLLVCNSVSNEVQNSFLWIFWLIFRYSICTGSNLPGIIFVVCDKQT